MMSFQRWNFLHIFSGLATLKLSVGENPKFTGANLKLIVQLDSAISANMYTRECIKHPKK